jgi:hypothetical protein
LGGFRQWSYLNWESRAVSGLVFSKQGSGNLFDEEILMPKQLDRSILEMALVGLNNVSGMHA